MIRTILLPSATSPLVSIRVYFGVGSVCDPRGKEGLAALTAAMLGRGGSRSRRYAEVLAALYPMAARIDTQADKEAVVFSGTVHRDNLEPYADLLADQIVQPRFADEDLERNRRDALDHITRRLRGNDDETLGKEAFGALLYRGHPYGHPCAGTEAGLAAITLSDVRAFHAGRFTQDRLILGLAGGYPDDVPARLLERFTALPPSGLPLPVLPPPPARRSAEVLLVEKDAPATAISLGHPLRITRAHPDFY
ncbi:MAG TPA: insulinase family protein, partial [Kofleriaceae bacterium]|nr:insulinase family protein [Kofleriaceae bacterium]